MNKRNTLNTAHQQKCPKLKFCPDEKKKLKICARSDSMIIDKGNTVPLFHICQDRASHLHDMSIKSIAYSRNSNENKKIEQLSDPDDITITATYILKCK